MQFTSEHKEDEAENSVPFFPWLAQWQHRAPVGSLECFSKPVALGSKPNYPSTLKNELRAAFWGALAGASLHCTQLLLFVSVLFVIFLFIKTF